MGQRRWEPQKQDVVESISGSRPVMKITKIVRKSCCRNDIEKTLGIEVKTHTMEGDSIDVKEREVVLTKWSLIEAELESARPFNHHFQTHNQYCIESRKDKIMAIISGARLKIHRVVEAAFQDIQVIQDIGTSEPSSPVLVRSSSTGKKKAMKEESDNNWWMP